MVQQAYKWYEKQHAGLGEAMLTELNIYFNKIEQNPDAFKKVKDNFRQIALKRFPFVVVYEVIQNDIIVFAVFHTKRNPKFKTRK
jgi:toxin ParE1/3/4